MTQVIYSGSKGGSIVGGMVNTFLSLKCQSLEINESFPSITLPTELINKMNGYSDGNTTIIVEKIKNWIEKQLKSSEIAKESLLTCLFVATTYQDGKVQKLFAEALNSYCGKKIPKIINYILVLDSLCFDNEQKKCKSFFKLNEVPNSYYSLLAPSCKKGDLRFPWYNYELSKKT